MTTTTEIPQGTLTVREFERVAGMADKYAYKLIRTGRIESTTDVVGQVRIPREAAYAFLREREKSRN